MQGRADSQESSLICLMRHIMNPVIVCLTSSRSRNSRVFNTRVEAYHLNGEAPFQYV